MIKHKRLVEKTMPPEKERSARKCIVGHYLVRPISNIVSIPLIERGIDPTIVTEISGLFIIIAFFSFLFISDSIGFWIGWISLFIWNVLDGVDGNIARYCNKCSMHGELWDAATGWLAIIVFYLGMGLEAFHNPGHVMLFLENIPVYFYIIMGSISALFWIFPRLVMHKKAGMGGTESIRALKRENYGFIKLIVFNITSINGFAALIFLFAHIFKFNAICVIFYFVISLMSCSASLYFLLKKDI